MNSLLIGIGQAGSTIASRICELLFEKNRDDSLINSFINDKEDNELFNALNYLVNFILPAKDVREVNEQFYNFRQIIDDIIKCK